jgi:hypothetical protein
MMEILKERGIDTAGKKAQCGKIFNCAPPAIDCCCRHILYNQPDFTSIESLLEIIQSLLEITCKH